MLQIHWLLVASTILLSNTWSNDLKEVFRWRFLRKVVYEVLIIIIYCIKFVDVCMECWWSLLLMLVLAQESTSHSGPRYLNSPYVLLIEYLCFPVTTGCQFKNNILNGNWRKHGHALQRSCLVSWWVYLLENVGLDLGMAQLELQGRYQNNFCELDRISGGERWLYSQGVCLVEWGVCRMCGR